MFVEAALLYVKRKKKMIMFQLTLIRHGETEANKLGLLQGQLNVPLSNHGKEQARKLAERLAAERFFKLYTSDLSRCLETTERIAAYHQYAEIVTDNRLRERCYGRLEGRPHCVVNETIRRAGVTSRDYTAPGGESFEELHRRVVDFFNSMCSDYCELVDEETFSRSPSPDDQTALSQHLKDGLCGNETVSDHIVVVSHGGTISCLMRHFAEYGCEQLVAGGGVTPNTAINSFVVCVERYPHPKCVSVRMLMSHDLSHLEARGQC